MNKTSWLYAINGKPLLTPDEGVQMGFVDLLLVADEENQGTQREKVCTWHFHYKTLTQEAYSYMLPLLKRTGSFTFTYPDPNDPTKSETKRAYIEEYSVIWQSAKSGLYRNLKFDVVEY